MSKHNYYSLLQKRVKENKSQLLFQKRDGWSWKQITWLDFEIEVKSIASFLLDMGFKKGDKALVISPNSLESLFVESAVFMLGGEIIPFTLTPGEIGLDCIMENEVIKYAFLQNHKVLENFSDSFAKLDSLERIFLFSDYKSRPEDKIVNYKTMVKFGFLKAKKFKDDLDVFSSSVSEDQPALSFYKFNGNKSAPKILTQEMFIKFLQVSCKKLRFLSSEDQSFSFLPSVDLFSKLANFLTLYAGSRGAIAESERDFFSDVLEVMPTIIFVDDNFLNKTHEVFKKESADIKRSLGGRLNYILTNTYPGYEVRSSFVASGISIIELSELSALGS